MSVYEKNINILSTGTPIIFSHKSTLSLPQNFALHIHPYYEIYICISGDVNYIVRNYQYHLNPGDIIVIPPHELHSVILDSPCEYDRFYFQFSSDALCSLQFDLSHEFEHNFSSGHNLLRLSPEKKKSILSQLFKLDKTSKIETSTAKLTSFATFLDVLSTIIHEKKKAYDDAEYLIHSNISPLVADALNYLEENFRNIVNMSEISDSLNVTYPYLSSLFKKALGISLQQYLQHLRIAHAKQLLEKNLSITDVCFKSGFNDCSYFIKKFRQSVGITPHQYKKEMAINPEVL